MLIFNRKSSSSQIKPAELYKTTISIWVLMILLSSAVFYFAMPGSSISDAILESSASWTGTGIGAFDSAAVPVWLQLFRSVCNWIGGIGIIMISLSILKPRRVMGWTLAATEFPGPYFLKSDTDFRRYYRRIPLFYAALTVIQFLLLMVSMSPVQAAMTALSNTSTAGLHHINNGVITGLPVQTKAIITLFAFLSSVYCPVFIYILRRKWNSLKDNSELKFYTGRILLAGIILTAIIVIKTTDISPIKAFTSVIMQLVSSLSTSGYIISDTSTWPAECIIIITMMTFAGACSLSTGGGFKSGRLLIALKMISYSLYRQVHPNSIKSIKYDNKALKSEAVVSANLFIALFMITYFLGALLLSLDNVSLLEALSYSRAMLTGSGIPLTCANAPGLATGFSAYGKIVMSFLMLAGRLEVYPLLMFLLKPFWKTDSSF